MPTWYRISRAKAPTRIQSRSWRRTEAGASAGSGDMLRSTRNDDAAMLRPGAAAAQRDGDVRRPVGDGARRRGTSGASGVTGGARDFLIGWAITLLVVVAVVVVNALTV